MHFGLLPWLAAFVAGSLAWLPRSARRRGGLGLILVAAGTASMAVAAGGRDPLALAAVPPADVALDAGAIVLGLVLVVSVALAARRIRSAVAGPAWLAAAAGLATVGLAFPILRLAPAPMMLVAAAALLAGGGLTVLALDAFASRLRTPAAVPVAADADATRTMAAWREPRWFTLLAAVLVAMSSPHVIPILAASLIGVIATAWPSAGRRRALLAPAVAVVGLVPFAWLLWTIAGPLPLSVAGLPELPLSTAAESMLMATLTIGALPFFGMWPFARRAEPLLVPIGVALLVRIGAPTLPDGLAAWQTVLVPIGVLGLWRAAASRRGVGLLAAGAWLACSVLPDPAAAAGGWTLAFAACVAALRPTRAAAWGAGAAFALATWGGSRALPALLSAEVVYAVLALGALATAIILTTGARRSPTAPLVTGSAGRPT